MSLKRYATKRDASEPEILRAIAKIGARYILLDAFDVLVLYRGHLFMLENKSTRGKKGTMRAKTRSQTALVDAGWPLHFVTTPEQAVSILTGGDLRG